MCGRYTTLTRTLSSDNLSVSISWVACCRRAELDDRGGRVRHRSLAYHDRYAVSAGRTARALFYTVLIPSA